MSSISPLVRTSSAMQSYIWDATVPLYITHESIPVTYRLLVPRLSYLPFLLPRLNIIYGLTVTSFYYQGNLLMNLPVGLLCDIFQPTLPWQLTVGDGPLFEMHDTFINSVKEADFVRNGTAKGIMSLSKGNSKQLWHAVQDNDLNSFLKIQQILLNPPTPLKHIPIRLYVPSPAVIVAGNAPFKAVQKLVASKTEFHETQTLGSALNHTLHSLFPCKTQATIAEPILHGSPVPFDAPLEELMREAAYADGWLHICVRILPTDG